MPDNAWPTRFKDYVERSNKWVHTNKLQMASPERRRAMYFGHRMCRAFDECIRLINNVNPAWKRVLPTLPPGLVPADVLYWVRRES